MGDGKFNCDHCGFMTYDGYNGEAAFRIRGWKGNCGEDGDYNVCAYCDDIVKGMLELRKRLVLCCMVEHKTSKKRHVFDSFDELEEWVVDNDEKEGDYRFFVRKSIAWECELSEAWVGEGLCGGMTEEEAKETIELVCKEPAKDRTITVGWRHHEVPSPPVRPCACGEQPMTAAMTCAALQIDVSDDVESAYQRIRDYARENHLENTPFLIEESVLTLGEKKDNILELFCFPERDSSIMYARGLAQVKSILNDARNAIITKNPRKLSMNVAFLPSQRFIEHHRTDAKEMIKRAKRKLSMLNELEEDLKKREQRKRRKCDGASPAKPETDNDNGNDDVDQSSTQK